MIKYGEYITPEEYMGLRKMVGWVEFPLEQALIPSCIELTVQELMGSRYAPEDKSNDAKDNLADVAVTQQRYPRPVENSNYKPKQETEE